jgi:murein DD-endopeptidase MepM/ murein hydrolase activator NlpD
MILKPFKGASLQAVTQGYHKFHKAIDWLPLRGKLAYGTPLVTPEKVKIEKIYGNSLTTDDKELTNGYGVWMQGLDTGFKHLYWHTLPIILANTGDVVEKGKIIAFVGNSGNVISGGTYVPISERLNEPHAGTHLHQSIFTTKDGLSFDPLTVIDFNTEPNYTTMDFIKAYLEVIARISKLI